jgi:hypothetical protein
MELRRARSKRAEAALVQRRSQPRLRIGRVIAGLEDQRSLTPSDPRLIVVLGELARDRLGVTL